jgi:hypothetical protein
MQRPSVEYWCIGRENAAKENVEPHGTRGLEEKGFGTAMF